MLKSTGIIATCNLRTLSKQYTARVNLYLCQYEEYSREAEEDDPCSFPEIPQVGQDTYTPPLLIFLRNSVACLFCLVSGGIILESFWLLFSSLLNLNLSWLFCRGVLFSVVHQVGQHLVQDSIYCGIFLTSLQDLFKPAIGNRLALTKGTR